MRDNLKPATRIGWLVDFIQENAFASPQTLYTHWKVWSGGKSRSVFYKDLKEARKIVGAETKAYRESFPVLELVYTQYEEQIETAMAKEEYAVAARLQADRAKIFGIGVSSNSISLEALAAIWSPKEDSDDE